MGTTEPTKTRTTALGPKETVLQEKHEGPLVWAGRGGSGGQDGCSEHQEGRRRGSDRGWAAARPGTLKAEVRVLCLPQGRGSHGSAVLLLPADAQGRSWNAEEARFGNDSLRWPR